MATAPEVFWVPVISTAVPSTVTFVVASMSTPPAELISIAEAPVPAEVISKVVAASVLDACNLTAAAPPFLPVMTTALLFEVIVTSLEAPVASIETVPAELISTPAIPASICTPPPALSASIITLPANVVTNLIPPLVPVATNLPPSASSEI
jgi:hypothetical protein